MLLHSAVTIEHLQAIFATHGLREVLVTDNGSVFCSAEFNKFTSNNGIRHIKTAPYHPSSNGLAERAVQTFKMGMKKQMNGTIKTKLSRFLFQYRITPHTTTGVTPAELLLSRQPRTHLDLALPSVESRVIKQQERQATYKNQHSRPRVYHEQDAVLVRNFSTGPPWLSGTIINSAGPRSFEIKLTDGRVIRRHVDHIRSREPAVEVTAPAQDDYELSDGSSGVTPNGQLASSAPLLRRSCRNRRPPSRYGVNNIHA